MDEFGMLGRDLGFKPQGKSASMADNRARSTSSSSFVDDHNRDGMLFSDIFGGPPKYSSASTPLSDFDYDSFFMSSSSSANDSQKSKHKSVPVYDKPVYDDDIDIYDKQSDKFDLLGNLVRTEEVESKSEMSSNSRGFDDLIPGFGSTSPTGSNRSFSDSSQSQKPTVGPNQTASNVMEDPFTNLGSSSTATGSATGFFTDPPEEISNLGSFGGAKMDGSSAKRSAFDDIDPLNGFGKSVPSFSSEMNSREKDGSPKRTGFNTSWAQTTVDEEPVENSSFRNSESSLPKKMHVDSFQDSNEPLFDIPAASTDSRETVSQTTYPPSFVYGNPNDSTSPADVTRSEDDVEQSDDIWLTVSEIPLFTQPTSAPSPSRPPPPVPARASKSVNGFFTPNARRNANEFAASRSSSQNSRSPNPVRPTTKNPKGSQIDELEAFAMGRAAHDIDEHAEVHIADDLSTNSGAAASAAAMKDTMDRAEEKLKQAKEVWEREYAKASRSKEGMQDDQATEDTQEREFRENQEKLERERRQREREEGEREQRKLEKEKERLKEIERQRELARHAVERATREARERAGAEARERAAAEARLRVERAAVQRAQAEARERAAIEAKERAQRAAAEARQRENVEAKEKEAQEKAAVARAEAEARRRAERAAVERAAAEARERAAVAARERAAAAKVNQQKNDNDLESFFGMGSRPSSAPRPRENYSDPMADQSRVDPEASRRTSSVGASSNTRKASSTTNIVDDLSSIFGAAPSSGDFQDVEGENEERRRARMERHQRTMERAANALAEKNQRDLQTQRDQEERHRISETLDIEIKRWSAGKEGNLRALLSTLQYVLWPECGWQPVSLTDLIVGASVKKAYRKATLCIHPDKVQQKGANLQQKYVAEKVFDLLKEAWNKFNSEELF